MIGSVPRRAYLVLFALAASISGLAIVLFLTIPPDASFIIPEPFSPLTPPPPPPLVGQNVPTDPIPVQTAVETIPSPTVSRPVPAYHITNQERKKEAKAKGTVKQNEKESKKEKAKSTQSGRNGKAKAREFKYFHEAGGTLDLVHYDKRFFIDKVPYEEHLEHLRSLIRSYLLFTNENGIETWIAHGTLLGWWWNQRIMPWDYDLDVQVKSEVLAAMGDIYNMTLHSFTFDDLQAGAGMIRKKRGKPTKSYVLDVNPNSVHRSHMKGLNVIDARWIDVDNGMFIDITGLTELEPNHEPGVLSCKNGHHYKVGDLYPLQESVFEGVKAMVPKGAEGMLSKEYGPKCLKKTEWEGHRWNSEQKEWLKY